MDQEQNANDDNADSDDEDAASQKGRQSTLKAFAGVEAKT